MTCYFLVGDKNALRSDGLPRLACSRELSHASRGRPWGKVTTRTGEGDHGEDVHGEDVHGEDDHGEGGTGNNVPLPSRFPGTSPSPENIEGPSPSLEI